MVVICSATVRSSGLRCTCPVNGNGTFCGRHGGLSRSRAAQLIRQSRSRMYNELNSIFDNLTIVPDRIKEVEMDYVSKFYCCICMEDVKSKNAGYKMNCCKKGFCVGCINTWVKHSTSCPHCRTEIN